METNGYNSTSPEEQFPDISRSILPRQFHAENLRQRRSPKFSKLIFREATQTAHEIRNGSHTREFYLRHGLLSLISKTK